MAELLLAGLVSEAKVRENRLQRPEWQNLFAVFATDQAKLFGRQTLLQQSQRRGLRRSDPINQIGGRHQIQRMTA